MKQFSKIRSYRALVLLAALAMACACQGQPTNPTGNAATPSQALSPSGVELSWPRQFEDNGIKASIFQPQIEKWEGTDFETRSAVAVTPPGSNAPIYGVFWMKARADVDKAARIVTLNDIVVTRANFPSTPNLQSNYLALIRKHAPLASKMIALDHLEAEYAISEAVKKARAVPVKNDPPRIIYSTTPGLLVLVDGPPVFRPIPGLSVERVINTRALILKFGDHVYLYASDHWYESNSIDGIWNLATNPPEALEPARQAEIASQNVDLMPPGTNAVTTTPTIYLSTIPAELIQTEGPANLVPIEGTDLMQVQNSDNALFLCDSDQHYYVLLSGRWFKSSAIVGTWEFVPYKQLPSDFAKIPPTHPKANVLVSVPGTPQANEAVIANSIPQTATVQRHEAKLDVTYDGAPAFKPITGTSLQYAVNTQAPVIEVNADSYYSVENGVWFDATSPNGPWEVATNVPPVIYSIPVSSPLHYVTYAQVYGSTPDDVYVGYTPGYLGTEVCPDNVVVYGTGWSYPPYIGSYWVGGPCTYGFGAGFADNWDVGFGFGFGGGLWLGTWAHPWWGPYGWGWHHHYPYNHVSLNHVDIYNHWEHGIAHSEHNYGFNSWNGREWSSHWGTHFNPYSGRGIHPAEPLIVHSDNRDPHSVVRPGMPDHNLRDGTSARVSAYDGNFHSHISSAPAAPAAPAAPRTTLAPGLTYNQNLYGGSDGSVYRQSPSAGWQRNTGSTWQTVPRNQTPALEQHALSHSMGEQRFNNFRSFGGGFSHSAGGFAHSGGGGGHR
jgi:hypothetical protein